MRNEAFGRLLRAGIGSIATCEGKTAPIVEDELGQQIGVSAASIQRYKSGHLPPEPRTIQILAEAAVRRGYLNREWLREFLHVARYPAPDPLVEQLCPGGPARPRPTRVYQNLPAPTYSQFVMRAQAFAEVLDGLQQRSALVLIASLGGMGKTSLAREIAARCLREDAETPRFDAAVWVSDKDRPGTTTLSIVLDEIARTLDYPGFTQFEHDEKRREVENLLRRQKVLLIVDNFETIGDGALLAWLLRLPEPSKALITTREYTRAFRNNTSVLDLRGMSESEAQELIDQRLRFLKIEKLVSDHAQLEPLVVATGGNPKAIEVALGIIKHERQPLQQVVDDLYAARGELFDDLFARAWNLLDEGAKHVLMSATFFPDSASGETLGATADVKGFAFDRAVERLIDLALLDTQQADLSSAPRYMLHPLVRAFAGARLGEQSRFESEARERWVEWYVEFVSEVGYCWNDLGKLDLLDSEQENVYFIVNWMFQSKQYDKVLQLCKGASYYYHQRGLWERSSKLHVMRAEAARNLADYVEESLSLAYNIQLKSKQGNINEAKVLLDRMLPIAGNVELREDSLFESQHALALYYRSLGNLTAAQGAWEKSLQASVQFSSHRYLANRQWLGFCLLEQHKYTEAKHFFLSSLQDAEEYGHQRFILTNKTFLAQIDLIQDDIERAAEELAEAKAGAEQFQDRASLVYIHQGYARLHTLRGDLPAARAALAEAIDLFERLGMRRELAEAREELARLERDR